MTEPNFADRYLTPENERNIPAWSGTGRPPPETIA